MAEETDLEKANKLIEKLRAENKRIKEDKEPQSGKDQRTIAALKREIDELKPLAEKARKDDEAGKTLDEKVEERLQAAEKRAQEAEARALRLEVVTAKGLTQAQAKYLRGDTKEELESSADEILEDFPTTSGDEGDGGKSKPAAGGGRSTTSRPKENLGGGNEPDEEPDETDPRKLAGQVSRT